jgi:mRNA-degrading endonuclease RelE of RelBE toxin-antitoxin system
MAYRIGYTPDAVLDLRYLGRRAEALVRRALPRFLADTPAAPSRKRKAMAPNPLGAAWELRLDDLWVYYDIEEAAQTVRVLRVGRKLRERVFVRGVETDLREPGAEP